MQPYGFLAHVPADAKMSRTDAADVAAHARCLEICESGPNGDFTTSREPIWQLEQRMRCRPCSEQRCYPYKRGHLVRLRGSPVKKDEAICSGLPSEIIT
jgi:hypothetical protein